MNNYKIIENRPELTSAQVLSGMNFAAVKAGALASTTTIAGVVITKGLITKLFISAIVISSAMMIYTKDNTNAPIENKEAFTSSSISEPNHYGDKPVTAEETPSVLSTSLKPTQTEKSSASTTNSKSEPTVEKTNEVTSNAVSTLTSPTTVMQIITMPTIALTNPGPAVCQPGPNSIHHTTAPLIKPVKDSAK